MSTVSGKKALLLGSGFVATPTVEVLSKAGVHVTVACRTLASAEKMAAGFAHTTATSLDATDAAALEAAIAQHDVVISLIPYTFHAAVIQAAIAARKHVVTTSYVSPAMLELDAQAKEAGITVMNEIGLDPGIDHLYAVKTIEEVHQAGGKITSFLSYCGGLPAPEDSDNPLGYKFSWSSRGALLALRNDAKFWKDGKISEVAGPELMNAAKPYYITPGFNFVAYPNRDSSHYKERYNIPEAHTIIRGTLRFGGFPEFIKVIVDLGFLSDQEHDFLKEPIAWKEATAKIIGASASSEDALLSTITTKATFANDVSKDQILTGLKWLGLFSDKPISPKKTPLDVLCATLEEKMQFEPGERDLVMLQHRFEIENKDGTCETRTSTLCEYGAPTGGASGGFSAMAKLVGVPCGVAVLLVLDGTIADRGILAPMTARINEPLMRSLKEGYGIELREKVVARY